MVLSWKLDLWKGFMRNSVYPKMYCQVATTAFAVRSLLPQTADIKMCTFISFAHNGTSLAKMSDTILYKDVSKLKVLKRLLSMGLWRKNMDTRFSLLQMEDKIAL